MSKNKGNNTSVLSTLLQNSNVQGGSAGIVSLLQSTLGSTIQNAQDTVGNLQNTVQNTVASTGEIAAEAETNVQNTVETTLQNTLNLLSLMSIEKLLTQSLKSIKENAKSKNKNKKNK